LIVSFRSLAPAGTGLPSVSTISKGPPWMCIGWMKLFEPMKRTRTFSPTRIRIVSVSG